LYSNISARKISDLIPNDDSTLAELSVSNATLATVFSAEKLNYDLWPGTDEIVITATAGDPKGALISYSINDGETKYLVSGEPSSGIAISTGSVIKITVEAANGSSRTYVFNITTKPSNTGSSGGSGPTDPTPLPVTDPIIIARINGKPTLAAVMTKITTAAGQTAVEVAVDQESLRKQLAAAPSGASITIPINDAADVAIGQLNGQMVKDMESRQAVLEVKTETAAYTLPAQQINISAISDQLGSSVELKDIKIQIEIVRPAAEAVRLVENSARKGEFSIVAPPVEFNIKGSYKEKTVELESFNAYVERTIAIPDGIDPGKITTGIIVNPDGTTRHVPTTVTAVNGKYYAVISSLTNSLYSVVWHPLEFRDVADHWAKEAVNDMGSRMVINGAGNGMFKPDRDITRAEFAAVIVRALGLKPGTGINKFTDVNDTDWYCDYIKTAAEYKIISGYGSGKFGPNDKITREQAMTMVYRAMSITGLRAGFASGETDKLLADFKDVEKMADYAGYSIAACIKTGIISGRKDNMIAPKDNITRAEVAVIVRRLLQKSGLI
jgi:hypothetical protein